MAGSDKRQDRANRIAKGAEIDGQIKKDVAVYREVEFDQDELSIRKVTTMHHTWIKITKDGVRCETILGYVRIRWLRIKTVSPRE